MSTSEAIKARVTHRFNASPEAVFDAWVTSAKVRKWFAPGMGEIVGIAIDPRVGGGFSFVQRRGLDDVDHRGTYLEFMRPHRLGFTWTVKGTKDRSVVYIDIDAAETGSMLTLTHELAPHWANYRERMEAAWQTMLNAMADAIG